MNIWMQIIINYYQSLYIQMDRQPIQAVTPAIRIHGQALQISEHYEVKQKNRDKQPQSAYPDTLNLIKAKLKDEKVNKLSWKWANNLTQANIFQLLQILPPYFVSISLNGSMNLSIQCLQAVFDKFKSLRQLNIYYSSELFVGWDLNYHINIQNSMKNYRQSQKWCHAISQSLNTNNGKAKLTKTLSSTPSSIRSLCLRNTSIGKIENSIQILLETCPHLEVLDLGQTHLTDQNIQIVPEQLLLNLRKNIWSLKIDCNRITSAALRKLFPHQFTDQQKQQSETTTKQKLRLSALDISRTNITNVYESIYKNIPSLSYLGISYLQINDEEVLATHQKNNKQQNSLAQMVLQYVCLSVQALQAIVDGHSHLTSLTLTNIDVSKKYITQVQREGKLRSVITIDKHIRLDKQCKINKLNLSYNKYITDDQKCLPNILTNLKELQILKISGTKINYKQLLSLGQFATSLKWLEISHLEELFFQFLNKQSVLSVNNSGLKLLNELLLKMPKLCYLQAYGLLNKKQIEQFLQQNHQKIIRNTQILSYNTLFQDGILIVVLDTTGPIHLSKCPINQT